MNNCPHCNTNLIGDPIPEDIVENYSGTHWRREIAIDGGWAGIYDGVVAYRCPDCAGEWPRSDSDWAKELFRRYKDGRRNER